MMPVFEGNRSAVEIFLRTIGGKFYVYVLSRPDGTPFYVGKGLNRRVLEHEAEARRNHLFGESNPFKCNVIRKIIREGGQVRYRIDSIFELADQHGCLQRESALIIQHKRLHEGGHLTNLAGGVGNLSGAAPFSLVRHAATLSGVPENNPDRATLNRFLLGIGPVESVPVKPVSQMARILPTTPHPSPRTPTPRCAFALIASASASGLQIATGALLPRMFTYDRVIGIIENGVARDILKAGMADLVSNPDPRSEQFLLSREHAELITRLYGRDNLIERGLI